MCHLLFRLDLLRHQDRAGLCRREPDNCLFHRLDCTAACVLILCHEQSADGTVRIVEPLQVNDRRLSVKAVTPQLFFVLETNNMTSREVDEIASRLLDHLRSETICLRPSCDLPLHGADALMQIDDNVGKSCALCSNGNHV